MALKQNIQILFGIGIGLVLSGTLVMLFPGSEPTEMEVIAAARNLGMVFKDEVVIYKEPNKSEVLTVDEKGTSQMKSAKNEGSKNDGAILPENESDQSSEKQSEKVTKAEDVVRVTIPRGSNLTEVADILEDAGAITSAKFLERADKRKVSQKIIAGTYNLVKGSDVDTIIDLLTTQ
ncbi:endolytic transglycosylase MltG [Metallumcola ferriviriculae]|uniref:Endolytic transglycosylase MltG n=1 Tax=Metallumcola ferriviriculae TaxID=3039180 RepID=A0AAU0UTH1_9FIRM|nr:endolytic transglycosylase MltG [Desulfitibacteraceae bacterium MK1]